MSNFEFSFEQANDAARSIEKKGSAAKQVFSDLDNEINNLKSWWKGDSADAYVEEFSQLKTQLDKLVGCVNEISQQIKNIADIKREAENDIAAQIRRA